MSKIGEVLQYLEQIAPPGLQESYDNAGLITGNRNAEITGVLVSLDCTEEVIQEAIERKTNLVIAHHPIVFKGLKKLTGDNYVERTVILAIKHDIAIYAIHTNLDSVMQGVNYKLSSLLGLKNLQILKPNTGGLMKIVTFIPQGNTSDVIEAIHETGAGTIGDYNSCSFRVTGTGRYTPGEAAEPLIGSKNKTEEVTEDRVEIIFPVHLKGKVLAALKSSHPYEEVAYYLTDLANTDFSTGAGMIGELNEPLPPEQFLEHLKTSLNLEVIRYTSFNKPVKKVAVCGGSGSFLIRSAVHNRADAFVTGDVKYHEFFDAEGRLMFCDVGHYESEVATKELLYDLLTKKFTNFALHLSESVTNPIKYYK